MVRSTVNEIMSEARRTLERVEKFRYILILEGVAVGILAGIAIVAFRLAITNAEEWMEVLRGFAKQKVLMMGVYIAIVFALAMFTGFLVKKEGNISGSGIPQVKGEMLDRLETKWIRVLAYKLIGGAVAIAAGLSVGREGPSVQLGAMAGKGFSKMTNKLKTEEKLLMSCGAGAGLAASFNAPLAGVVFTLEELHKNFSEEVMLATMSAAITADFVSSTVFGLKPIFTIRTAGPLPLREYWLVIVLGIVLGAFGVFYNATVARVQDAYGKMSNVYAKMVVPFGCATVLAFVYPKVLGGGSHLVEEVALGGFGLGALILLLVMKYCFSMISFGSSAPGGIFLPLLVMGAVTGGLFFNLVTLGVPVGDMYLPTFVILGMAGFFSGIVRAPITGIILISEMTGSLSNLLTLSIVSLVAYVTADILGGKPIYNQLLERILSKKVMETGRAVQKKRDRKKVLVESPVYFGAPADGLRVSELSLPKGALIVSLTREDDEIVPYGDTVIRGGDRLVILASSDETAIVDEALDQMCRRMKI